MRYAGRMKGQPRQSSSAGPFRAHQIREGDPYELSNGHPISCMGTGDRHGTSNTQGAKVIDTDPGVEEGGQTPPREAGPRGH